MKISFSPPDITELEVAAVAEAMRSGWITTGPKTKEFEKRLADFIGTSAVVCLNSATAAMELVLRALGVGPGDEVITSAYTYSASASVINHVGAKIVLVDTAPGSYFMDLDQLSDAITTRTRVIIPVDLGGVMADYDKIYKIVEAKQCLFKPSNDIQRAFNRVVILADAAHSIGATYRGKSSGTAADFTAFSFHAVKNLTTAEGGAITWLNREGLDNELLYKEFQLLSLHGQSKDALSKAELGSWEYDIIYPSFKCNMTDIAAAIGLVQLKRYPKIVSKRLEIAEHYNKAMSLLGVEFLSHSGKDFSGNGHLYLARVPGITEEQRNRILIEMADAGIACNVHYKPLPMFTGYKKLGFSIKNFPNAYCQYQNEISLPLHSLLDESQVTYVIETFHRIIQKLRHQN